MKLKTFPQTKKQDEYPFRNYSALQLRMAFDSLVAEGKTLEKISKEISSRQKEVSRRRELYEKTDDLSALPEQQLNDIRKNIKDGAKDTEQLWANALELVHKAYEVAQVQRPDITMEAAWKQYEEMIEFAVKELGKTRGADGEWRMTTLTTEAKEEDRDEYSIETDLDGLPVRVTRKAIDIDEVIKPFFDHNITGCDIEIKQRSPNHVILYWCNEKGRTGDKVVIKKVTQ